jgi:Type I phosphodiesterase / nucleotide pyrophosphatase
MRKLALALSAALLATSATAAPPKLIVAISVDQFAADVFDAYRPGFTGGFARLAAGTVFRNGYQSHSATETCPGHSTILTGDHPARTGIVGNSWIDQSAARADKVIYCAEDERVAGSTSTKYTVSPLHLRVATLGERLKAVQPASRTVAVAGKDRAAVMMSGQAPDQRWYWDGKAGFTTDLTYRAVPRSVAPFNAAFAMAQTQPRAGLQPTPQCAARAKTYTVAPGVTVGAGQLARGANDTRGLRASPELDGAVLALGAALTREMQLGRGPATDVLALGLSATDYVGHAYGWGGQEMCLQLTALDRELEDFFNVLDRSGVDYAVVLTADHGSMDIPERLRDAGVADAARADPGLVAGEMGKLLQPAVGTTFSPLLGEGIGGDVWLDRRLTPAQRTLALAMGVKRYQASRQVETVFTAEQLARTPVPSGAPDRWTLLQRVRAAFDPKRSGDFYVVLKSHVSPIARPSAFYVATHGSAWDYDRRVPILFWRKGQAGAERTEAVDTVDIAPTLAALEGLSLAKGAVDGRCLGGAAGTRCPR